MSTISIDYSGATIESFTINCFECKIEINRRDIELDEDGKCFFHCEHCSYAKFYSYQFYAKELQKTKGLKMGLLKAYFKKHEELLITLSMLFIVDHFFLGGKCRDKMQEIFDSLFNRAQKQIANATNET